MEWKKQIRTLAICVVLLMDISGTIALDSQSDCYSSIEANTANTIISIGFDTGHGAYPSIFGTHNGTIKPNQTITVSKLYTYPCVGTSGHTEYAAFAYPNGTLIAEAHWNDYKRDGHNISFDKSFTLVANENYNYTIITSAYPQIIHAKEAYVIGGKITCTEFIDTHGKRYADRIPAIRLAGPNSINTMMSDMTPPIMTSPSANPPDTTPPIVTSPSANPPVITNDGTTYSHLTVNVIDDTLINLVTIDLSPIGGPSISTLLMYGPSLFGLDVSAICDPGTYNLCVNATDIYWNANTSVSIALTVIEARVYAESSDITGDIKDIFALGESVYAIGSGYSADTTYNLYVVEDTTWIDGMAIPTRVSGAETSVTTDATGDIAAGTLIWTSCVVGIYDIVVDVNGNGLYDANTDALDSNIDVGFETIPEFSTIAIPVVSILGLLFLFSRRRKKEE